MGQVAACSEVCKASRCGESQSIASGDRKNCICGTPYDADAIFCRKCGTKRPQQEDFPPDVRLIAWLRRRNGPEADFGDVFNELFGSRDGVGPRRFIEILQEHGYSDGKAAFAVVDRHTKSGLVGASDLELLQMDIEDREAEGLKHLRAFLKENFSSPAAAYKELGKGEGDVLNESEFSQAMKKIGFEAVDSLGLFHFIDKDYSGEISFAEFKSVMRTAGVKKKDKEPKSTQQTNPIRKNKTDGQSRKAEEDGAGRRERTQSAAK